MLKSRKTNTLAGGLIEKTSSKLDEKHQKLCITTKMIDRGKRSKTLGKAKPIENVSKNPQNFLEIRPVQKEVLPSLKLQDQAYA